MRLGFLSLAVSFALACASTPVSGWGYSSWYPKFGIGSMGKFDHDRADCLEQAGISADPEAVESDSPEENRFIGCMNTAGWCSNKYHCDKAGAS